MEPEFYAMAPPGVITCTTRVPLSGADVEGLLRMGKAVEDAALLLGNSNVDAVILGCTSGSFVQGPAYNDELIRRIGEASGAPATTTTTAVVSALRALGAGRVSVVTPYIDEVNERARAYLEESGIEVCSMEGLGFVRDEDIHGRTPDQNYRYGRRSCRPAAQALVMLCTALRTAPIISALEADLGKPVVTAIQASLWHGMRIAGVQAGMGGFGRLFTL
jgi:maleate isomerase